MVSLSLEEKTHFINLMGEIIPHANGPGIELHSIQGGELTLRLPYRVTLVGNPASGVLHSGALTVLLDQTLGLAAICSDDIAPAVTPTLDLRIDHLGVAPAGRYILATARVYRATRKILFVEGHAWCESLDNPLARATGTFVRVMDISPEWVKNPEAPPT